MKHTSYTCDDCGLGEDNCTGMAPDGWFIITWTINGDKGLFHDSNTMHACGECYKNNYEKRMNG